MGKPSGGVYVSSNHTGWILLYSPSQAEDTCLDMSNETKWINNESFGKYMSMISNGNEILALDEDGTLYLIDPNPKNS